RCGTDSEARGRPPPSFFSNTNESRGKSWRKEEPLWSKMEAPAGWIVENVEIAYNQTIDYTIKSYRVISREEA
ncbi:MAG: hypothetical protein K9L68_14120, partial [Spirochaetales bacterium]|nr:hypothetical protein [Spirochaetales bacterium]MCF7939730.1 hypothetical protein [Spirochaetales bacterium]